MNNRKSIPPKYAQRFLRWFIRDEITEEVQGDLEENFYLTLKNKSLYRANLNYWFQVLNYLRPFAIRKSTTIYFNHSAMFQSYFKIGWRNILRNKGYSAINIGGLALGMAVAMLIGLWVLDELSFNKYHRNYGSIARLYRRESSRGEIYVNPVQPTGLGTLLKADYSSHFKQVVLVRSRTEDRVIASGDKKFTQSGYFMQDGGPEMFSLRMKYGTLDGLKEMNSILLSETLSRKLFGDMNPVNQVVSMDARIELKVTGVYKDLPKNSEFSEAAYFAPIELFLYGWADLNVWNNYNMFIYAQINPNESFEEISALIRNVMLPHIDDEKRNTKPELFLLPMRKWHLDSRFENGVQVTSEKMKVVRLFGIIAVFVLLLACINFMNLSTARSERRAREVGIRKSIGSLRSQLVQQFLGESLLVTLIAFVFSLIIVQLSLNGFNRLADKEMSMPWTNPMFWTACLAFNLVTGLLAGSYPALYLSSFKPVKVLKGAIITDRFSRLPRRALVIIQFTVSLSLALSTIIVYQQIQFAKNRPSGYSREALISFRTASPEFRGKFNLLRTELINTGVVEDIAESNYSVTSILGWNDGFSWKGQKI
ncbi:MAG TPA: permease prefix domain 2-containing transporter, partial [Cyclobacteriaceae bacterium]|nr:permease prefix domain 2-containing transporter [Cyclobacteriaceae bacterium]